MDLFNDAHLLIRWLHVIAGIAWIGHLYFFNFVNIPLQGSLDDATKKIVNPQLMPRALFWFRWGAMVTFIVGLILFTMVYMYTPGIGFGPTPFFTGVNGITGRAWWVLLGMLLGTVMWFNVWFVIWPAQKRLLGLCGVTKATPEEAGPIRTRAAKMSRINTYLSGPMLLGMLAASHHGDMNWKVLIFIAIAMVVIGRSYALSKKVS
jgi:uncharacterized membrane protein